MNAITQFIFKHPFISYLFGSAMISGATKMTRTIAYAITGREGLKPGSSVNIRVTPPKKKEEETNEPTATVE